MAERSIDPTRTTLLRRRFMSEARRRFRAVAAAIRKEVAEKDGFGLVTNRGRFEFPRSAEKVDAFMGWLEQSQREHILTVGEGTGVARAGAAAWTNTYIETAYQRGISDAGRRMRGQGVEVEDTWIRNAFNRPVHADRVGLIYTRTYRELRAITEEMDEAISNTLARGIAEGRGARQLARDLAGNVTGIGMKRAQVLARTEVIDAHAEATLNSYEEAGVEGVEVESEFTTANDSRVCPRCERLEGRRFTLSEARGRIPVHPNCRCAWSPVIRNGSGITLNRLGWRRAA